MEPRNGDFGLDPETRSEILESVLEAIDVPFLVVDRDYRLLFFSVGAASLLELKLTDVGRTLPGILPDRETATAFRSVDRAIHAGVPSHTDIEIDPGRRYRQQTRPLETPDGILAGAVITYAPVPESGLS